MRKITRINLSLSCLLLALGLINWLEPSLGTLPIKHVTTIDVQQVQKLKLYRQQVLVASLQRENDHWQRQMPLPKDCNNTDCPIKDNNLIEQWLHFAQMPSLHSFPAPIDRLDEFGLDAPAYQLVLDDVTISIGTLDPASRLRYLMTDQQIHLISDSYYHTLAKNP